MWDSWDSNRLRIQEENYCYESAGNGKNRKKKKAKLTEKVTLSIEQLWALAHSMEASDS